MLMVRPESPTPWYKKPTTTLIPWRGAGEYTYDPRVDEPPSDDDWDPRHPNLGLHTKDHHSPPQVSARPDARTDPNGRSGIRQGQEKRRYGARSQETED